MKIKKAISGAVNALAVVSTFYGLYNCVQVKLPENLAEAGHKQFLTNLGAGFTMVHASINLVNLLSRGKLHFLAREVTFPVALVLETIITLVYWPLRLFFIGMIMHGTKEPGRSPLPISVDISVHLLPLLYLLVDYFFLKPEPFFVSDSKIVFGLPMVLGAAYRVHLDSIIGENGNYPYPFLDAPEPHKSIIFVVISMIGGLFFVAYRTFHKAMATAGRVKCD